MTLSTVIFACEGREHLLRRTWDSFRPQIGDASHQKILAVDGKISCKSINLIQPDIVVRNVNRKGYVSSIYNALPLIKFDYFLWLEDDWVARQKLDLTATVALLKENPSWLQVRWSKLAELVPQDHVLVDGIYYSSAGFSANPSVCRTELVRSGFEAIRNIEQNNIKQSFEIDITDWVSRNDLICGVHETKGSIAVEHMGYLEMTGRHWHALEGVRKPPRWDELDLKPAPIWRRVWMVAKLCGILGYLGIKQLVDNTAYELASRVTIVLRSYIRETKSLKTRSK